MVEEFAADLKQDGIRKVVGDRYGGEFPRELFRVHGITYEPSTKTRSELYLELLSLVNSARVELPLHSRLLAQLKRLERRVARGGKEFVDHSPGDHDDLANASDGVGILAIALSHRTFVMAQVLDIQIGRPSPPTRSGAWKDQHEGKDLNGPFVEDRLWHKLCH